MNTRRLAKTCGFHGLQTISMLVLFLSVNLCYGISYQKALDAERAYVEEVSLADEIELEEVFSAKRAGGGWAQGFTVTKKYFVVVTTVGNGDNFLTAYDKKTFEKVKSVRCDIGHGNDLTYNDNTDEIVALGGDDNTIKFFDASTLEEMPKRQIKLGVELLPSANANGIAYNADLDRYYTTSPKAGMQVWGGDFIATEYNYEVESPFNLYQTLSYHKGNLFYSRGCHVRRGVCERRGEMGGENLNTQESYAPSSGAVIVYDARTGRRDSVFYIPPTNAKDKYYGEFEGASIDEKNSMYFLYSSYGKDLSSVGKEGTFVVFKLAKGSKMTGNAKLKKMLNRQYRARALETGLQPLRK